MNKLLLLLTSIPLLSLSQVQIGGDIDGEYEGDYSGMSVSLSFDGSSVAIGATRNYDNGPGSGHVRVFDNINGNWIKFGQDLDGDAINDEFGRSVSLSANGNILAIGSSLNNNNGDASGHVKIYERVNNLWMQIGNDIEGASSYDFFGSSVSLSSDGSIIAIGAESSDNNGLGSGHVGVYQNVNDEWIQIGQDINGESESNFSGGDISLSGNGSIIAIGASSNSDNGDQSGHVRIFKNIEDNWIQIGQDIDGENAFDFFGSSVSLSSDGSIVAIGAVGNDGNGNNSGHVRIFENINDEWIQMGQDIDGENASDRSGNSISLSADGSVLAVGSFRAGDVLADSGQVRIFSYTNSNWVQVGQNINGEDSFDRSGMDVSLSSDGSIVAIGAPFNNGSGFESGHARVFDLSSIILSSDEFILSKFVMYPNPSKESVILEVKSELELENINVYNSLGQLILTSKEKNVNTSKLSAGTYVVEIETSKGRASRQLIIE